MPNYTDLNRRINQVELFIRHPLTYCGEAKAGKGDVTMMTWLTMVGVVYLFLSLVVTGVLVCIFVISGRTNEAPERSSKSAAEPANEAAQSQQAQVPYT